MIKRIKNGLSKRKVKIFSLFLLCSGLAWFLSNLSELYTHRATFNMEYVNIPDSLLLTKTSQDKIDVKLRASGFQFLWFNFLTKKIAVDLSAMESLDSRYFVTRGIYKKQIERQLANSMSLLEIDSDTLFFDFFKVYTKEVPIKPVLQISMAQNYLLDGKLNIDPNTIKVTGPKNEIDTLHVVRTEPMVLPDLTSDFSKRLVIPKPESLKNTAFSLQNVNISGKVSRFSEKIIDVPVEVIGIPEGTSIKTFPNVVSILCKAKVTRLKKLNATDFQLVADYTAIEGSGKTMLLALVREPGDIHSARLLETQVEYILKRE
ncbi:MAG: YbbR-like domain-containing protein [Bacteroidota bacterium]